MSPSEHLQAAQRAELECLAGLLETTIDGFDRLSRLQLQNMRDLHRNASEAVRGAVDARDAQQWAALPTQVLRGDGARMAQYMQQMGEIGSAMQAGFAQALQQAASSLQQNLQQATQPGASQGDGAWPGNWMRDSLDLLNQAMQGWTRSQEQAARSLGEQMQRMAPSSADGSQAPAAPRARAAAARGAA